MRRLVFVLWIFSIGLSTANVYTTEHFKIISNLDSLYVRVLQDNVEGYYENMVNRFFDVGWDDPLLIYYFEKQSDTQAHLGNRQKIHYGVYIPKENAIYTHRVMDKGGLAGLGTLFHEVTHHFVRLNYKNPPAWFNEGLTCFLSEQSRLVNGVLKVGHPNLWREQALREMINSGISIDVRYYMALDTPSFYKDRKNYHPLRALFYWVNSIGKLEAYLQNVQMQGYGINVLEETVGMNVSQINTSLLSFIQTNCYAGAYIQDYYSANTFEEKEMLLNSSLSLMPEYSRARLELGKLYFFEKNHQKCVETLSSLLNDDTSVEYKDANLYLAKSFYRQKDLNSALEYYHKALEYSLYDEYHYQIYFWLGNCYAALNDKAKANHYFTEFLANNWEPDRFPKWCRFAREYIEEKDF